MKINLRPTFPLAATSVALFFAPAHAQNWQLRPVSARQKLVASAPGTLRPFRAEPIQMRAVKGEWVNFQFVVSAGEKPIESLEIRANGLSTIGAEFISSANFQFFRENFHEVKKPSGNLDLRPAWWPDALVPFDLANQKIAANQSAVFWASLKIPPDAVAGDYFGELDISANGAPRRLALTLQIENRALPPTPKFRGTVALYYDTLRDWYRKAGREFSDSDWAIQKKRFYDFLLDFRVNAYDLPVSWNSPEAETYLQNPRVTSVRTPPLDAADFALALEKFKATGTLQKAFYYWIDEPTTPQQFQKIRETTKKLRALGIKHLVTAHPNTSLEGAVDIWCPNIGDFFGPGWPDAQKLAEERKKGREIWLYTMVEPKFPYPTWLLDDDASAVLEFSDWWRKFGASGFVYSMCHGWGPKPLETVESYADTNGDGTLLYPAELVGGTGPMPSIRLMLLRDAIEDWELGRSSARIENAALRLRASRGPIDKINGPISGGNFGFELDVLRRAWEQNARNFSLSPRTKGEWKLSGEFLTVSALLENPSERDYLAVELLDEKRAEKWRFVLTPQGRKIVERRSREGGFEVQNFAFEAHFRTPSPTSRRVWFKIPLGKLPFGEARLQIARRVMLEGSQTRYFQTLNVPHPFWWPLLVF